MDYMLRSYTSLLTILQRLGLRKQINLARGSVLDNLIQQTFIIGSGSPLRPYMGMSFTA